MSDRSVRRWFALYEDLGLGGLYDGSERRANRNRRLTPDELALMGSIVNGFMDENRPTQEKIYEDVKNAFKAENEGRRAEGRAELHTPSRKAVREAIKSLDPFQCDIARLGLEEARRRHAPVGRGLELTRPLERVEMDAWTVDLVSMMAESGLLHYFSDEDRARLRLDDTKGRWRWLLTVAICATTRCIVGMRLSRTSTSRSAIQTVEMITRDKHVWADAAGALSPWDMRGTPLQLVMDCANEYITFDTRVAAQDLGIDVEHAPAGHPEMRARIERLFRAMSISLMPRLTGRTFSNIIEKGDRDPRTRAALSVEDLCTVLVRWVVDIYHRKPHEGLDGESPANCWKRLIDMYGVCPPPDLRRRRLAFGTRDERSVRKDGIRYFGVRYHSEGLARWALHARDKKVNVRWYPENIGVIAVEIGGEWFEVPAVFEHFNGVQAQTLLAAVRSLRARHKEQAAFDEHIVLDAIRHIDKINGDAMRRMGLLVEDWSPVRVQEAEEGLLLGFECQASVRQRSQSAASSSWGIEMPTAVEVHDEAIIAGPAPQMSEDNATMAKVFVSAPKASHTDPEGTPAASHEEDAGEDPGFKLEDK